MFCNAMEHNFAPSMIYTKTETIAVIFCTKCGQVKKLEVQIASAV